MADTWLSTELRYSPERDAIELVDPVVGVVGIVPRNMVIRMLGMLPPEPPERDNDA